MVEVRHRQLSGCPDAEYAEIHIPDDKNMGDGTFTTLLKPNALSKLKSIHSVMLKAPVFKISLNIESSEITVMLGRADGSGPISRKVFDLPSDIDASKSHTFITTFKNWQITGLKINEIQLEIKMPTIEMCPGTKGFIVPSDLLTSEATLVLDGQLSEFQNEGVIFKVEDNNFMFSFFVRNYSLVLRRNESVTVLPLKELHPSLEYVKVITMWSFDELYLGCGEKEHVTEVKTNTVPVAPPQSLVKWARMQGLIPTMEYTSEEEFRAKVYTCLASIQDKINKMRSINVFWDIEYSGKKIITRRPKNERDIHPIIQCMLCDQMLLASIEVIPEYKTAVGNMDFLFLGTLKNKGRCKLCAEFKHAHSKDIYNGLEKQLPAYMRSCDSTYGAYCVLGFKGEWFDEPKEMSLFHLNLILQSRYFMPVDPIQKNIRVLLYDLSKPASASKLK